MSTELLTKVEQLNKILKRCSAIMVDGNSATDNVSNEKDIKCLTNKVSDLQVKLSELKSYSNKLEEEVIRLKGSPSCRNGVEGNNHVPLSINPSSIPNLIYTSYALDDNTELALLQIFRYLSLSQLLNVQRVCKSWCKVTKQPLLWQHLALVDLPISQQTLCRFAMHCNRTKTIHLQGLIPPPALPDEDLVAYISRQKASLEPGLDSLLSQCGPTLTILTISECSLMLTERCLWLVGKYCSSLSSFVYNSNEFPATPESLWSLANGCTGLRELDLWPSEDSEIRKRFTDKCLNVISVGFPLLTHLTIGGERLTIGGISSSIGSLLKRLKYLSIVNGPPFTVASVTDHIPAPCLHSVQSLCLTHTRISPQAVVKLIETHVRLKKLELQVTSLDYFPAGSGTFVAPGIDTDKFTRIISNLQALADHDRYGDIFKLKLL